MGTKHSNFPLPHHVVPKCEVGASEIALVAVGRRTAQAAADADADLMAAFAVHLDDLAPVVLDSGYVT